MRNEPTPPRAKTVRRWRIQTLLGLPLTHKLVVLRDGKVLHPTKGGRGWPSLPPRARPKRKERDEHLVLADRMTNWQRSRWGRAGYDPVRAAEFVCLQRRAA